MIFLQNQRYKDWVSENLFEGYLTFYTPTYNRSRFVVRIHDMLLAQTCKKFVWILVDDGSKDDTVEVAKKLLEKEDMPMMFISKENGHKHSTFKVALGHCETEYFMCMDDDDVYSPESAEVFLKEWSVIKSEGKTDVGAIRTLTKINKSFHGFEHTTADGTKKEDISTLDHTFKYKIKQENWTCYETKKLKEIDLFPEGYWLQEKHRFFNESIWQGRFARKYKCRYINISLRQYGTEAAGILRNKKSKQHYMDMFINNHMIINEQYDYVSRNKKEMIKQVLLIQLLRNYLNIGFKDLLQHTKEKKLIKYYLLTYPISFGGKMVIKYRNK